MMSRRNSRKIQGRRAREGILKMTIRSLVDFHYVLFKLPKGKSISPWSLCKPCKDHILVVANYPYPLYQWCESLEIFVIHIVTSKFPVHDKSNLLRIWMFQNLDVCQALTCRPTSGKERSLNIFRNALVRICELTALCDYICPIPELTSTFLLLCWFITLLIYSRNRGWFVLISKLIEPPYNLRSEGKMTTTDNPTGNSIVVTNNSRGIRGKGWDSEWWAVTWMEQEMESLREELQKIRKLAHLAMTTLSQPP